MTGPFARAVAVALVGIALGSLPGAVSGAPQDSDEIPVVVKPWVKKYVNQDVLKSLRSRLHDLIGEDEIGKASIEITYRGDGLHVVAVTTLPTLKGREYSVRRFLLLTTAGWDRMPGAEPIKTKTGDYEWKVSRAVGVNRIFDIDGTVIEMTCSDEMSFNETGGVLSLIKHNGLVPSSDLKIRDSFKSPWVWQISQILRTANDRYEISTRSGESQWYKVYHCRKDGQKLIVLAVGSRGP